MYKIYNIALESNFYQELAKIILESANVDRVFLPNNRSCRALKRELSKCNCIAPEILSISEVIKFPEIDFKLVNFLRHNTSTIPFNTFFDLAESLASLIRTLVFNNADYHDLIVPEQFNENWKRTLVILDYVWEHPELLEVRQKFEAKVQEFFSSLEEEHIVVAGLLEENFYNRLLYAQALRSGFVVLSGLEKSVGANYNKIYKMFQEHWDQIQIEHRKSIPVEEGDTKILELMKNSDEALAIALITREMVYKQKSVAIVCSNLALTHKIKMELLKWNIIADDSSGVAFYHTVCGQIISQIIYIIERGFHNTDVINFCKHKSYIRDEIFELESLLRYKENYPLNFFQTFDMVLHKKGAFFVKTVSKASGEVKIDVQKSTYQEEDLDTVLDRSEKEKSQVEDEKFFERLSEFVKQLQKFAEYPKYADFNFWLQYFVDFIGLVNKEAAQQFEDNLSTQENLNITLLEFCVFLKNHFLNSSMQQSMPYTHGVVILGILESQLIDADLIIIGGANESSWKSSSDNDFWMSESMLRQLNINTVDERNEFYACVLEKLLSKQNVIVTRSLMESGEQSQIYSRLRNADLTPDIEHKKLLYKVKSALNHVPYQFEAPCPQKSLRPTTLWVTDLDLLISNPYVYYAKKVLKLKELKEINERINLQGNLVHEILDKFVKSKVRDNIPSVLYRLFKQICHESFISLDQLGLWYFNIRDIFEFFNKNFNVEDKHRSEIKGSINLRISDKGKSDIITIASKADRLSINANGKLEIVDYKTGLMPSIKKVEVGEKIQLPVEAIIASRNGFQLGVISVEKMSFWQLKARNTKIADVSNTIEKTEALCKYILDVLCDLLKTYFIKLSAYDINIQDIYNQPYMHLARVKELENS